MLVAGLPAGVTAIAAGPSHTCASANGGAYCWGDNVNGQLGNGSALDSLVPQQVLL
jgi:alpha-tubulin suppressor-like RCC1 family protein